MTLSVQTKRYIENKNKYETLVKSIKKHKKSTEWKNRGGHNCEENAAYYLAHTVSHLDSYTVHTGTDNIPSCD